MLSLQDSRITASKMLCETVLPCYFSGYAEKIAIAFSDFFAILQIVITSYCILIIYNYLPIAFQHHLTSNFRAGFFNSWCLLCQSFVQMNIVKLILLFQKKQLKGDFSCKLLCRRQPSKTILLVVVLLVIEITETSSSSLIHYISSSGLHQQVLEKPR